MSSGLSSTCTDSNSITNEDAGTRETIDDEESLYFHRKTGSLIKLSQNQRTAERLNSFDEFNNGVAMTYRYLKDNEFFEIRIEDMVSKWSGSIEIGVTTHDPDVLDFPQTMTNLHSGTIMMSGCGILINGKGSRREYGQFNLDELKNGDRVGLIRHSNGDLHYFINGLDQGIATTNVPQKVWGVIDLYGMTTKVTIIDHQMLRHNFDLDEFELSTICGRHVTEKSIPKPLSLHTDHNLVFHDSHSKMVSLSANNRIVTRSDSSSELSNTILFSNRPLKPNEIFEIRISYFYEQCVGDVELGFTSCIPDDTTATDLAADVWTLNGSTIYKNKLPIVFNYSVDLDSLANDSRIAISYDNGANGYFFLDGVKKEVAWNFGTLNPSGYFVVINFTETCKKISITSVCSPPLENNCEFRLSPIKSIPNVSSLERYKFLSKHGKNVVLKQNCYRAVRINGFDDSLIFADCPLKSNHTFEISILETANDYAGNLRIGVTSFCPKSTPKVHPLNTIDIDEDCWYLSGSELKYNHEVLVYDYCPNINRFLATDRIAIRRNDFNELEFFVNDDAMEVIVKNLPEVVYAFVDLFGACSSVRIENIIESNIQTPISETKQQKCFRVPPTTRSSQPEDDNIEFHLNYGQHIELMNNKMSAKRVKSYNHGIVMVRKSLKRNQAVEITIDEIDTKWESSLFCGLLFSDPSEVKLDCTSLNIKSNSFIVSDEWIMANNTKIKSSYGQRLQSLQVGYMVSLKITSDNRLEVLINDESLGELDFELPNVDCYPIFDIFGQCTKITIHRISECYFSQQCEKASLEIAEKEQQSSSRFSLSISSSIFSNNGFDDNQSLRESPSLTSCSYLLKCVEFYNILFLPDTFFSMKLPNCYCINCYKFNEDDIVTKTSSLMGWVRFPLKSINGSHLDTHHVAFYYSRPGLIRNILETQHLLTEDQQHNNNYVSRNSTSTIKLFPCLRSALSSGVITPTRHHNADTLEPCKALTLLQLLLQPGSYTVSHLENDVTFWTPKESGNMFFNSLLVQLCEC